MLCLSAEARADRGASDHRSGASVATARYGFFGACALLFVASAAATVLACLAMAGMGEVPLAGGWSMSTSWTPLCGGAWGTAAAVFLGMWIVMTLAMMLPSLAPALWRFREKAARSGEGWPDLSAACAGLGYLAAWTVLGCAVFAGGALLLETAMRWPSWARAMPLAAGFVVIAAGVFEATAWKRRRLDHCREVAWRGAGAVAAMGQGLRFGLSCCASCAGLTAVLLVGGVMDLRVMAAVAAAISAQRLVPGGACIARIVGFALCGVGGGQAVQALWLA